MLVEKITSRQNPLVKRFRRLHTGADRHLVLIEGVRMVEEALAAGAHFESIAFTSELDGTERGMALQDRLQRVPCRGAFLSKQVMEYISDTDTPQGVAAIVTRPNVELEAIIHPRTQLIVIADGIQDPGNLGAIVRSAEASGATGMVVLPGTTNPFGTKSVRASMGSVLRFPVAAATSAKDVISMAEQMGISLIAAVQEKSVDRGRVKSQPYTDVDYRSRIALIVGNEGSGVSDELLSQASALVHIPMAPVVESLNVAAAASIILYEAARQRGFSFGKTRGKKRPPDARS